MLIMLVINILVCPEILLVYYDAASIRPPISPRFSLTTVSIEMVGLKVNNNIM